MLYSIQMKSNNGQKNEGTIIATSVDEARQLAQEKYPDSKIIEVTLVPTNPRNVVIYYEGEQYEACPKVLFDHNFR